MELRTNNVILLCVCLIGCISDITTRKSDEEFDLFVKNISDFINSTTNYVAPVNNDAFFLNGSESDKAIDFGKFDFIIVGAGAAGGILANRLTEILELSVLVIEAGKEDPPIAEVLGLYAYLSSSEYCWGYSTTPQNFSCLENTNHQCAYATGKVLGGGATINDALYSRGNAKEFDRWGKMGNQGWSYKDCLPYFKKSENAVFSVDIDPQYHGYHGPQATNHPEDIPVLTDRLIDAFKELGKVEGDYNGRSQLSISRPQNFFKFNKRSSTAPSFIHPAMNRKNFKLTLESLATKILFKNPSTASGVEFWKHGKKYVAHAKKEVILSAGTFNSPQLLMLSGIGPKAHLEEKGIEVIADLPVGENMIDHVIFVPLYIRTNLYLYNNTLRENLELWEHGHRPLTAGASITTITYNNTQGKLDESPDVEILVFGPPELSPSMGYAQGLNDAFAIRYEILNSYTDLSVPIILAQPHSVGNVKLNSSSPRDFPLINPNYFSDPEDLKILYRASQGVLRLKDTKAFRKLGAKELKISPPYCDKNYDLYSEEWWVCNIQRASYAGLHAVGTTRMGVNRSTSVTGSDLKVHGFNNLRVVDCGVMPTIVSGHTNGAVAMVSEKIADTIKIEYGYKIQTLID